jgi:hypothetical protein
MGDPTLSPDEIRATAEVLDELGPDYRDAVVESFPEKIDKEVGARIDAQLASARQAETRAPDPAILEVAFPRFIWRGCGPGVGNEAAAAAC